MGNSNLPALRGAAILAVILLLPGCIPWSVSLAMTGISYVATGKSVSDHVLSGLVQQDCNIGRAVLDQTHICRDDEAPEALTIADVETGDDISIEIAPASGFDPGGV